MFYFFYCAAGAAASTMLPEDRGADGLGRLGLPDVVARSRPDDAPSTSERKSDDYVCFDMFIRAASSTLLFMGGDSGAADDSPQVPLGAARRLDFESDDQGDDGGEAGDDGGDVFLQIATEKLSYDFEFEDEEGGGVGDDDDVYLQFESALEHFSHDSEFDGIDGVLDFGEDQFFNSSRNIDVYARVTTAIFRSAAARNPDGRCGENLLAAFAEVGAFRRDSKLWDVVDRADALASAAPDRRDVIEQARRVIDRAVAVAQKWTERLGLAVLQ
ncbi:hypothetical protein M885DRAFT_551466 [Pelagophyceae sp. CCMP2097]|nr:hypothetical protein M885DRAFT_551466 [Pelagophyceae sp. CCMP2097]|mmetsp:Transcript_20050/g.67923  ORF Transcript_20050/g.67923 Transcript_20050/m.67923 type:complete len:272 (-) Transcript_20050:63-878(-)